jgi:riboflavin transporter FmnP
LGDLIAVATFVGVAGWVYRRRPQPSAAWFIASCGLGAVARILVMIPVNFLLLNWQFGMPPAKVAALVWPVIIPFNALVSVINTALSVALLLAIKRRGLVPARLGGSGR